MSLEIIAMSLIFDPELQYCPRCHEEYRADIATCAECTLALVSGQEMRALTRPEVRSGQLMGIAADEAVCTVRKGALLQIKELRAVLQQQGLPSVVVKESGVACGCRGAEFLLQVREDDLDEVLRVIAQEHWKNTVLADHDCCLVDAVYNPEQSEAVCPACGCCFATSLTACPDCGLCFA